MPKKTTIRCPYCNQEYLPAEIYYPDDFLGTPSQIIKTENGDVLAFDGDDMNTTETYTCDKCGKEFSVEAIVTFRTEKLNSVFDDEDDFEIPNTVK